MMATTHALVGIAIAAAVPNPIAAGGLMIASHMLMDVIPHWDFGTDWEKRPVAKTGMYAIADTVFAFALCFILFSSRLSLLTIFLAVSLSNVLDWLEAPWYIFFAKQKRHNGLVQLYHRIIQFQEDYLHTKDTFPHGVYTQIATVIFFWLLLNSNY